MPKVFAIQIQQKRNEKGVFSDVFDPSPAASYGEIVRVVPGRASGYAGNSLLAGIRPTLAQYSFHDGDHILVCGDPTIIFMVGAAMAKLNKPHFRILRWNGVTKQYSVVEFSA